MKWRFPRLAYTKQEAGDLSLLAVYQTYERNARSKHLPFSLSQKEFSELILQDCFYCGRKPSAAFLPGQKRNGIDRVDNCKGYTKLNIVTACKPCNFAKSFFSYETP